MHHASFYIEGIIVASFKCSQMTYKHVKNVTAKRAKLIAVVVAPHDSFGSSYGGLHLLLHQHGRSYCCAYFFYIITCCPRYAENRNAHNLGILCIFPGEMCKFYFILGQNKAYIMQVQKYLSNCTALHLGHLLKLDKKSLHWCSPIEKIWGASSLR